MEADWGFKSGRKSADHTLNGKGSSHRVLSSIDQKRNQLFSCFSFVLMCEFKFLSHTFPLCVCVCISCSVVSDSVTPWTVAHQAPLSVEFSRQEYWRGLPFPTPNIMK